MNLSVVHKYLRLYAEPEWELAASVTGTYACVLIVPACRESIELLDGYRVAARNLVGRLLVILVVNARRDASDVDQATNARLLEALRSGSSAELSVRTERAAISAFLTQQAEFDILVVDRSSPGFELPEKQGVGLARRIGADLALALHSRAVVQSPLAFCSDADTTLPDDYFQRGLDAVRRMAKGPVAALLFPFRHRTSNETELDRATLLYEISLRYYVLGLAFADSPYAYQSIGSTLALSFESYATVRGFPKLLAAEDFYVLDKLGKVGALLKLEGPALEIAARWSDRVPFGTGRGAGDIAETLSEGQELCFYEPQSFVALRVWIFALNAFAQHRDIAIVRSHIQRELPEVASTVLASLEKLGAFRELERAAAAVTQRNVLLRRLHTWFDALKTLRFVHELRDTCFPKRPWQQALGSAPFAPEHLDTKNVEACLAQLTAVEASLTEVAGIASYSPKLTTRTTGVL